MGELIEKITQILSAPNTIGLWVICIIVVPVFALTVISILEPPRSLKIPILFLGSVVLFTFLIIAAFAIFSSLLGFLIT